MSRRIVLSVAAGGVLMTAVVTGIGAGALAAAPIVHNDAAPTSTPGASAAVSAPPAPTPSGDEEPFARTLRSGDVPLTQAQLRSEMPVQVANDPNAHDVLAEAVLDVKCMAAKGYYYDPQHHGPESDPSDPSLQAFFGHTGTVDGYRWQDAGCHGASVHLTGNDNNH